jgi:hypothetical protein
MPCPAPLACQSPQSKVREVRPGVFHVEGLCPWSVEIIQVDVPCIYSPMRWARRKLTGQKVCRMKDISEDIINLLTSKDIASVCQEARKIPMKVSSRLLSLLEDIDGIKIPVSYCKRPRSTHSAEGKGQLVNESVPLQSVKIRTDELSGNEGDQNQRSAKADDAEIPVYLWDQILLPDEHAYKIQALPRLRSLALRRCKHNIRREFLRWFFNKDHSTPQTCECASHVI